MMFSLLCIFLTVSQTLGVNGPSLTRPDIFGLINILYIKADANLDGTITLAELSNVFEGFDKNHDGTVTRKEFVELWVLLTSQTDALANAYFQLADVTDDNVIDRHDYGPIYTLFDLNHDGTVSAKEFTGKWESIIRETPFAVLFTRADTDKNVYLSHAEFRNFYASFDINHDGKVDNREFDAGWSHADFALLSDADMLFTDIDRNHDGYVTGSPDLDYFFTKYDTNGDNKLALQEVVQMQGLLTVQGSQTGGITG